MPHIIIEATSKLLGQINPGALLEELHRGLSDNGWARLEDLKSRVHASSNYLAGGDISAEFIVCRLVTTKPRAQAELDEMGSFILNALRRRVEVVAPSYWWQCCVFIDPLPQANYRKYDSRASP